MTKYLKVPADLSQPMEVVELKGLDALQAGIGGGYIEGVNLPPRAGNRATAQISCPGARFYCDEEFVYKPELQVNLRASVMAQAARVLPRPDAVIGGDVLLFDLSRTEDDKDVTEEQIRWAAAIEAMLKGAGVL